MPQGRGASRLPDRDADAENHPPKSIIAPSTFPFSGVPMKSLIATFAMTLLIAAASVPASAARIGDGTTGPVGPTPYVPGVWRAKVKYVNPIKHPNGTVSTFSYIDITADTQAYCDSQLSSLANSPGVMVVTYCWFDAY